jgi:ribonuclease BN (tRNA processing enzyme)
MKLTFLGSGGAFTTTNYQSNILIEQEGHKLLFDCGTDIKWSLKEQNISPTDIEAIYISHLHSDHIGGLEYIGFMNYFTKVKQGGDRQKLIGDEYVLNDLWEHCLKGGMRSIQTIDANLETYFRVVPIMELKEFNFYGLNCKLIQTVHIVANTSFVRSFGLMITTGRLIKGEKGFVNQDHNFPSKKIFITSDTQFAPTQIKDFINMSDITFHDCEISKYESGVHAHYNDLKTLPSEMKNKIWLYHNDGTRPNAEPDGFLGFVNKGQTFEF